jgi:hypothetical protein
VRVFLPGNYFRERGGERGGREGGREEAGREGGNEGEKVNICEHDTCVAACASLFVLMFRILLLHALFLCHRS